MRSQPSSEASASRLANLVAPAIADAFDAYQDGFREITKRAKSRFETRDWAGAVADGVERLGFYGLVVDRIEQDVRKILGSRVTDRLVWIGTKAVYASFVSGRDDSEIAESFFNSVTRRIFATVGVDPDVDFVDSDFTAAGAASGGSVRRTYDGSPDPGAAVEAILHDAGFDPPFEDLDRDVRLVTERLNALLGAQADVSGAIERFEMVWNPFFRRKGAYLVGRMSVGSTAVPLALALLNGERGIAVDAVLTGEDDLSVLFSFTRSHFHVDIGPPHVLVGFLKSLMPQKRVAEMYIAIGFHKHGKTELYRDLLEHLADTDERFDLAPGTKGLVMVVFTMPGFDLVFKVIRDRFPPEKSVNRREVMRKYRLVFQHDRAGRLVEAQEFEHLKFDPARFAPALLDELQREAGQTVEVRPDAVVVHHAYVERRVTPLDLYVRESSEESARIAVTDFGQAQKDLAATNIFPGDLLPKNFGLTRHGRIVCYDYDELSLLTELCFRSLPDSDLYDEEMADEGWLGVGPTDLFPEEFPRFLSLPANLAEVLTASHGDLFGLAFWQQMQDRLKSGEVVDIFPYRPSRRLGDESRGER